MSQQKMDPESKSTDDFRDSIATVDASGKRRWIYPTKPKGRLHRARVLVTLVLLAILFGTPFIKIGEHPFMLFNIVERKFILFGVAFWPHDLKILVLVLISFIIFIVLFTVIFGRLWCGWACPQTIFMEMIFRKIEYWLEGDAANQRSLNNAPMSVKKLLIKVSKHSIFFALSFIIANTFLAWIIGVDDLWIIVTDPPSKHLSGLVAITIFSTAFYGVFSWFREQACVIVCPYGRFQSVLLDPDSIVVSYDFKRGEPRGKATKTKDSDSENAVGDCTDCEQCVRVCPTGIDIRNGTQLECVNCTACIDACNGIMSKLKRPLGLVRYTSYNQIASGNPFCYTTRMKAYTVVFMVLLSVATYLLSTRPSVHLKITKHRGSVSRNIEGVGVLGIYTLILANNTFNEQHLKLKLLKPEGQLNASMPELIVPPNGLLETTFNLVFDPSTLRYQNTLAEVALVDGDTVIDTKELIIRKPR